MESKVIVIPEGKVCDYIDGKFRKDTPEEYVRQTIEKRLINEHKYNRDQISIEYTVQIGSGKKRADIVIFPDEKVDKIQENIKIIIECKSEKIEASNSKDGVAQLKSYMSACSNAEWGMWTNSKEKFVFKKYIDDSGSIQFMDYNDIPSADGSLDDINRPKRTTLKNASDDNLLFTFKTCHNHIYVNEGMQKQPAFFELLKVIFCKIEDERNIPKPLEFHATSEERSNGDGQLTVKNRIEKIFERVKKEKKNAKIFEANDGINLHPRTLSYIVSELQKYSLLNTRIDIKGKAYEEIVGANLRGDRGEFFTPRNVMQMVVEMINPTIDEKVLDSSCGSGTTQAVAHKMNRQYIGVEQMDYINTVSVPRLQKVIEGEQGGISKDVDWEGGGSFVYAELSSLNEKYVKDIQASKSEEELESVLSSMKESAYLNFKVDLEKVSSKNAGYNNLSLEEKKEVLIQTLDMNQLYLSYSEMEDEQYNIPEDVKAFNHSFYDKEGVKDE